MSARRGLATAIAMLTLTSVVLAQPEAAGGKAAPKLDPNATPVIQKMCDYFKAVQGT